MTAQVIDFASSRRRLRSRVLEIEERRAVRVASIEQQLAAARVRLRAEARSLPPAFAAAALAESESSR